jgi:hypothetical protein
MATIAERIQQMLDKYGSLIEAYRGDIPAAVVAARIWHETQGNPCPTPTACCDEQGLLQLWPATRAKYGVTDACDPAQALYGGCAHWNSEANNLRNKLTQLGYPVPSGYEFWALAYLYTAIGSGATPALVKAAGSSSFTDVQNWVNANAQGALLGMAGAFGTQSPSAIATRVNNTAKYVGAAYEIAPSGSDLVTLAIAAGVGYLVYRWLMRRR